MDSILYCGESLRNSFSSNREIYTFSYLSSIEGDKKILLPSETLRGRKKNPRLVSRIDLISDVYQEEEIRDEVESQNIYSQITNPSFYSPAIHFDNLQNGQNFSNQTLQQSVEEVNSYMKELLPNSEIIAQVGLYRRDIAGYVLSDISEDIESFHSEISDNSVVFCNFVYQPIQKTKKRKENVEEKELKVSLIAPKIGGLIKPKQVHPFLYEVYQGKCQYCHPRALPFDLEQTQVEHIIPRYISLSSVPQRLSSRNTNLTLINDFCREKLPPIHDCLLNYILSCKRCNSSKGGSLPNIASLEFLLSRAKNNAPKILSKYRETLIRRERSKRTNSKVDVVFVN